MKEKMQIINEKIVDQQIKSYFWKRNRKVRFENGFDKKRKVIVGQTSYKLRNKGKT